MEPSHADQENEGISILQGPGGTYRGYKPISAQDLPYADEDELEKYGKGDDVDPAMLRDARHTSVLHLVIACFFGALFITFVIWQVLIAMCKVDHFCDMLERSTVSTTIVNAPAIRIPAVYVWCGLTAGVFGLAIASVYSIHLLRKPVGTASLVEIATHIYECSNAVLNYQLRAYLIPAIFLFVLVGVGIDWIFSGAILFGACISKITATMCVSVSTRANLRTAAAARVGLHEAARTAFRSGSIVGLSITSLGLVGVSALYLMLEDARVLVGFVAGTSLVALVCRIIGAIYTSATNMGSRLINIIRRETDDNMDSCFPLRYLKTGGDRLGDVAGYGIDLLDTYAGAVAVCALLGSLLPFLSTDPFAACVFNHLYIDLKCGSFGYPQDMSYAVYTCREQNMYLTYPTLTIWQSNSIFIAIPFLLAAIGIVVTLICTIQMYAPKDKDEEDPSNERRIKGLLWGFRLNVLLAVALMAGGSAAVCFIMLGRNSKFQKASGFAREKNIMYFQLDSGNRADVCKSQFEGASLDSRAFPTPHGNFSKDVYRPMSVLGYQFADAASSGWRLFLCCSIGLVLGLLLEYSTEFFTSANSKPVRRVAESAEYGPGTMIIQGLATGMLSAIVPLLLVGFAILGSFSIYGPYGTALMSVGLLSVLGIVIAVDSFGSIASSAGQMSRLAELPQGVQYVTGALEATGRTSSATGKIHANASGLITSFALLSALMYIAGLAPPARDVIGNIETKGTAFIGKVELISMSDIRVRLSMALGVMIPFLFAGLVLGSSRKAANALVVGTRRHIAVVESYTSKGAFVKAKLLKCTILAKRAALLETILPVLVMFASPLIVGWGFGQKSLVGFLISTVGSLFVVGTVLSDTGEIWTNAVKLIELGTLGEHYTRGSEWHETSLICESVGRSLKETAGSAMSILMKLIPYVGYLAVKRMYADGKHGWIGGIIFACLVVFALLFSGLKRWWTQNMMAAARVQGQELAIKKPTKQVSPFFGGGADIDPQVAVPGSQLADALGAAGNPRIPLDASMLPGLASRSRADWNAHPVMSATPALRMTSDVALDDARHISRPNLPEIDR